ncbi:ScyD/ScyE family protein [Salsipaludibacter albus]|uniref:ScyD/ScyE family protein n=1 Tax=Salsipaludibacter albus TaxID=2849650 RepID=UPI001EE440A3|nr:ScyD/ScyE family protein [Salsipaludibacter albus]MBY5163472.1 ScyD/ScyE family protein [Salsipaludibacter albus]
MTPPRSPEPPDHRRAHGPIRTLAIVVALVSLLVPVTATAGPAERTPTVTTVVTGLQGASGSTIGPDGALYVVEGAVGAITRIDRETGAAETWATGLPTAVAGIGGVVDVAFLDGVAHALVTLVGVDVDESSDTRVGLYRMEAVDEWTVLADLGAHAQANPPPDDLDVMVASGVHFALETWRGGFLVTDGHLNRLLSISAEGDVDGFLQLDNVVPTGLEARGNDVLVALAGPVPHDPADGRVVDVGHHDGAMREVARGAPLLVDVEFGRGHDLFGLAQGEFVPGTTPGFPPLPATGSLMVVRDGQFVDVVGPLDLPTSLEVVGGTAWIVTLTGTVLRVDDAAAPPGR